MTIFKNFYLNQLLFIFTKINSLRKKWVSNNTLLEIKYLQSTLISKNAKD